MYNSVARNKRNTVLIFTVFFVIIGGLCWWLTAYINEGWSIAVMIIAMSVIYAVVQYFASGSVAMAMNGAKQVTRETAPELFGSVNIVATNFGVPVPRVYIIDDPSPNAFTTGRNPKHALLAVTTGLMEKLDRREIKAVLAHEMSHVKNYDILVSAVVFGLVSAIGVICDMMWRISIFGRGRDSSPVLLLFGLVGFILAPIVAALVQLALSRQREYLADASSVLTTRDPGGLISALEKIKGSNVPIKRQNTSTDHLWFSSSLKKEGILSHLFSTHPPIDKRIERLRNNNSEKASRM